MIEAVIFDMDGLMINSEIVSFTVYKELLKKYDVELNQQLYCYCFAGKTMVNGLLFARDYFHLDYDIDEACLFCHKKEHEIVDVDGVDLKPGLVELLEYLKDNHIRMAIATSSGIERIHKLLDRHSILRYFDNITYGNEVKNGKPAPDIFLKACEKLNVEPKNALVLEDSEAGVQAGFSANIPTICVPDLKYPDEKYVSMSVKVLNDLYGVIDYIKGVNL